MPLLRCLKLIAKAKTEETREAYYRLWLVRYPMYSPDSYETFEEFYEKCVPVKIEYDMRSKDEIMEDILGKKKEPTI